MTTRTLSIEIPEALYQQIEALARASTRSASRVAADAVQGFLALDSWQIADIEAGLRDADAGDFASEAEVTEVFARHGA
jgi:predicted transcriptional regulator